MWQMAVRGPKSRFFSIHMPKNNENCGGFLRNGAAQEEFFYESGEFRKNCLILLVTEVKSG
jgi:hypothetical protein